MHIIYSTGLFLNVEQRDLLDLFGVELGCLTLALGQFAGGPTPVAIHSRLLLYDSRPGTRCAVDMHTMYIGNHHNLGQYRAEKHNMGPVYGQHKAHQWN